MSDCDSIYEIRPVIANVILKIFAGIWQRQNFVKRVRSRICQRHIAELECQEPADPFKPELPSH